MANSSSVTTPSLDVPPPCASNTPRNSSSTCLGGRKRAARRGAGGGAGQGGASGPARARRLGCKAGAARRLAHVQEQQQDRQEQQPVWFHMVGPCGSRGEMSQEAAAARQAMAGGAGRGRARLKRGQGQGGGPDGTHLARALGAGHHIGVHAGVVPAHVRMTGRQGKGINRALWRRAAAALTAALAW